MGFLLSILLVQARVSLHKRSGSGNSDQRSQANSISSAGRPTPTNGLTSDREISMAASRLRAMASQTGSRPARATTNNAELRFRSNRTWENFQVDIRNGVDWRSLLFGPDALNNMPSLNSNFAAFMTFLQDQLRFGGIDLDTALYQCFKRFPLDMLNGQNPQVFEQKIRNGVIWPVALDGVGLSEHSFSYTFIMDNIQHEILNGADWFTAAARTFKLYPPFEIGEPNSLDTSLTGNYIEEQVLPVPTHYNTTSDDEKENKDS